MQKLKSVQKLKPHFVDANESQRAKSTSTTPKTATEIKSKHYLFFLIYNFDIIAVLEPVYLEIWKHLVSLMVHLMTPVTFHNRILSRSEITSTLTIKSNENSFLCYREFKVVNKKTYSVYENVNRK